MARRTPRRQNLLRYSQDFSNGAWGVSGVTITGGFAAPDGTTAAQRLVSSGSSKYIYQGLSLAPGNYSYSVWLKGSGSSPGISVQQNGPGYTQYSFLTAPLTAGWVRYDLAFVKPNDGNPNVALMINSLQSSATVYAWGAQLNSGPLLPYTKTT